MPTTTPTTFLVAAAATAAVWIGIVLSLPFVQSWELTTHYKNKYLRNMNRQAQQSSLSLSLSSILDKDKSSSSSSSSLRILQGDTTTTATAQTQQQTQQQQLSYMDWEYVLPDFGMKLIILDDPDQFTMYDFDKELNEEVTMHLNEYMQKQLPIYASSGGTDDGTDNMNSTTTTPDDNTAAADAAAAVIDVTKVELSFFMDRGQFQTVQLSSTFDKTPINNLDDPELTKELEKYKLAVVRVVYKTGKATFQIPNTIVVDSVDDTNANGDDSSTSTTSILEQELEVRKAAVEQYLNTCVKYALAEHGGFWDLAYRFRTHDLLKRIGKIQIALGDLIVAEGDVPESEMYHTDKNTGTTDENNGDDNDNDDDDDDDNHGKSKTFIWSISAGSVGFVLILICMCCYCSIRNQRIKEAEIQERKRQKREELKEKHARRLSMSSGRLTGGFSVGSGSYSGSNSEGRMTLGSSGGSLELNDSDSLMNTSAGNLSGSDLWASRLGMRRAGSKRNLEGGGEARGLARSGSGRGLGGGCAGGSSGRGLGSSGRFGGRDDDFCIPDGEATDQWMDAMASRYSSVPDRLQQQKKNAFHNRPRRNQSIKPSMQARQSSELLISAIYEENEEDISESTVVDEEFHVYEHAAMKHLKGSYNAKKYAGIFLSSLATNAFQIRLSTIRKKKTDVSEFPLGNGNFAETTQFAMESPRRRLSDQSPRIRSPRVFDEEFPIDEFSLTSPSHQRRLSDPRIDEFSLISPSHQRRMSDPRIDEFSLISPSHQRRMSDSSLSGRSPRVIDVGFPVDEFNLLSPQNKMNNDDNLRQADAAFPSEPTLRINRDRSKQPSDNKPQRRTSQDFMKESPRRRVSDHNLKSPRHATTAFPQSPRKRISGNSSPRKSMGGGEVNLVSPRRSSKNATRRKNLVQEYSIESPKKRSSVTRKTNVKKRLEPGEIDLLADDSSHHDDSRSNETFSEGNTELIESGNMYDGESTFNGDGFVFDLDFLGSMTNLDESSNGNDAGSIDMDTEFNRHVLDDDHDHYEADHNSHNSRDGLLANQFDDVDFASPEDYQHRIKGSDLAFV